METQTHVVAKAVARSEITLDIDPTTSLRVHADRPLGLRFAFKIYESSQQREHWEFRLRTRLNNGPEATAEKIHVDKRMTTDDMWGFISTEHVIPAGRHELQFTLESEISAGPWDDAAPLQSVHRAVHEGTLILEAT